MSGNIEKLIKPGSSFEHVARWLTFCGAQSPFCNVSEKLPSQAQNDSSQLGVSVLPLLLLLTVLLVLPDNYILLILTESEVITGKSQTEALMYRPSDSEVNTLRQRSEISR